MTDQDLRYAVRVADAELKETIQRIKTLNKQMEATGASAAKGGSKADREMEKLTRSLQRSAREADRLSRSSGGAGRELDRTARSADRAGQSLARYAKGVVAGASVVYGIRETARAFDYVTDKASDLNEEISKSQVVFGKSAGDIDRWSRTTAASIGVSRRAALEATGTYGNLLRPMGVLPEKAATISRSFVELGADLASFNNASPEETLDALRALLIGEYEPARKYGIALSEASVQQRALADTGKKTSKELTDQDKILARYRLTMEKTTLQQGDAVRTGDQQAGSERRLRAITEDLTSAFGTGLLPVLTDVSNTLNEKLADPAVQKKVEELGQVIGDKLVVAIEEISDWFGDHWDEIETGFQTGADLLGLAASSATALSSALQTIVGLTPGPDLLKALELLVLYRGVKGALPGGRGARGAAAAGGARGAAKGTALVVGATVYGKGAGQAQDGASLGDVALAAGGGGLAGARFGPVGIAGGVLAGFLTVGNTDLGDTGDVQRARWLVGKLKEIPSGDGKRREVFLRNWNLFQSLPPDELAALVRNVLYYPRATGVDPKTGRPVFGGFQGSSRGSRPTTSTTGGGKRTGAATGGGGGTTTTSAFTGEQGIRSRMMDAELTASLNDDLASARELSAYYKGVWKTSKLTGDDLLKLKQDYVDAEKRVLSIQDDIEASKTKAGRDRLAAAKRAATASEKQWKTLTGWFGGSSTSRRSSASGSSSTSSPTNRFDVIRQGRDAGRELTDARTALREAMRVGDPVAIMEARRRVEDATLERDRLAAEGITFRTTAGPGRAQVVLGRAASSALKMSTAQAEAHPYATATSAPALPAIHVYLDGQELTGRIVTGVRSEMTRQGKRIPKKTATNRKGGLFGNWS